jgi:hypothetical protein
LRPAILYSPQASTNASLAALLGKRGFIR